MGYPHRTPRRSRLSRDVAGSSFGSTGAGLGGEGAGVRGRVGSGSDVEEGFSRVAPRMERRRRPWLRVLFVLFVMVEVTILALIDRFGPFFDVDIPPVTGLDGITAVGNNPDLLFPIKLGGELCRPSDLLPCTASDASALELATVCCTELFDSSSSGPEELISTLEAVGYVLIIPVLILLSRGFLLGRMWAMRPAMDNPCGKDEDGEAWGKRRWHLRVGFYALDSVLGLGAAVVTATLFTSVIKMTVGRPRPNYYALQIFSDNAASGESYYEMSIASWPSGHASTAMAGLLFLAYVLWRDVMAFVKWRRRAHPGITLVLAVLCGFVLAALPLSAVLIGITRIRDYWHRPDDVLAGWVLGAAVAHWSFQFVVLMPFHHEIGSPDWRPYPTWLLEEEREWEQEEEEIRLCPWMGGAGRKRRYPRRAVVDGAGEGGGGKASRKRDKELLRPAQPLPPRRAPEADLIESGKFDFSPA